MLVVASVVGGCGGAEQPAAKVYEDPGAKVRSIARVWQELSIDEGHYERDPNGVASFRIQTSVKLELDEAGGRQVVQREEVFGMRDGREFRCRTEGKVPLRVRYRRERDEIRVDLDNDDTRLPRRCQPVGFPVLSKEVPAASVTFALRAERLVAIRPGHVRATLLPLE